MKRKSNIGVWLAIVIVLLSSCKKDDYDKDLVTDIDGNVYHTVTIGSQVWMVENLKTTRYSDGTNIIQVRNLNDANFNYETYGRLYTWSAAMKGAVSSNANPGGVQGACPVDWHLPSDSEWEELEVFLGGSIIAGGKMKEAGTVNWVEPNTGATNESGFTALPGGRFYSYWSILLGNYGFWWSSTGYSTAIANYISLSNTSEEIYFGQLWEEAYISVRCIRDY
jgi:uncharacterized protein (TIGR02145 family)